MAYSANTYKSMLEIVGRTQRDRQVNYLRHDISRLAPQNPAYKNVVIHGKQQYVTVNSKDDYKIKEIISMPGEKIPFGSIVTFCDAPWIVTSVDLDDEINSKGLMYLCNCKMRWKDKNGVIHCYDGYAEDATKYSEGVESTQYLRIAEFQIKVKISVDEVSSAIHRDMRFVIDAEKYIDSVVALDDRPFVFRVTRRNIVTGTYLNEGYVEITLVQDQWIEDKDDYNLLLAAQPYELRDPYPDSNPDINSGTEDALKGGWL